MAGSEKKELLFQKNYYYKRWETNISCRLRRCGHTQLRLVEREVIMLMFGLRPALKMRLEVGCALEDGLIFDCRRVAFFL